MNIKEIINIENSINLKVDTENFNDKFKYKYSILSPDIVLDDYYDEILGSNLSEECKLSILNQLIEYNYHYYDHIMNLYRKFMYNSLLYNLGLDRSIYGKLIKYSTDLIVEFEIINCNSDDKFDKYLKDNIDTDINWLKSIIISDIVNTFLEKMYIPGDFNSIKSSIHDKYEKYVLFKFKDDKYRLENIINDAFYIKDFLEMEDK